MLVDVNIEGKIRREYGRKRHPGSRWGYPADQARFFAGVGGF